MCHLYIPVIIIIIIIIIIVVIMAFPGKYPILIKIIVNNINSTRKFI